MTMRALVLSILVLFRLSALAPAAATPTAPTGRSERVLLVRPGDTLAELLAGAGVEREEMNAAIAAVGTVFPPRALRPGQEIAIQLDPAQGDALVELEIEPAPGHTVRARRRDGRWEAEEVREPQQRMLAIAAGTTQGGLYPAVTAAGLPPGLALSLIRALGHQVDFQRDLQPGDRFSVLFERFRGHDGDLLGHGRVLQVELVLSGRRLAYWRHATAEGGPEWFDESGASLRRAFLRTPLDGARISSGFGMRSHPVLGFNRMHRGTDFAAPTGTPVYAAADGAVLSARFERSYGRIVRLSHAEGTETRYAHLSAFARGLAVGRRVRQGDVIGRVGSTGLATGPHLHYEVVVAGQPTDPARHEARGRELAGPELAAFQAARRTLARYAAAIDGTRTEIAMAE